MHVTVTGPCLPVARLAAMHVGTAPRRRVAPHRMTLLPALCCAAAAVAAAARAARRRRARAPAVVTHDDKDANFDGHAAGD